MKVIKKLIIYTLSLFLVSSVCVPVIAWTIDEVVVTGKKPVYKGITSTPDPTKINPSQIKINTNQPATQQKEEWCKWIKLNTNFPIIWNCIWGKGKTDSTTAFPTMIWALTKIVMSLVLVACFILIIYAGILWSADKPKEAKERLKRVAITILLLWFSGVILRLINPNFFS